MKDIQVLHDFFKIYVTQEDLTHKKVCFADTVHLSFPYHVNALQIFFQAVLNRVH